MASMARFHRQLRDDLAAAASTELTTATLQGPLQGLSRARQLLEGREEWIGVQRAEVDALLLELSQLREDAQRVLQRAAPPPPPARDVAGRPGRQQ